MMVRFCTIQETEGVIEESSFIVPHQADLELILSRSGIVIQHTQCIQEMDMYVCACIICLDYTTSHKYLIEFSAIFHHARTTFQGTSLRTHPLHQYRMGSCVVLLSVQLVWCTNRECGRTQQPDSDQRCSFGYAYIVDVPCSSCKRLFFMLKICYFTPNLPANLGTEQQTP